MPNLFPFCILFVYTPGIVVSVVQYTIWLSVKMLPFQSGSAFLQVLDYLLFFNFAVSSLEYAMFNNSVINE